MIFFKICPPSSSYMFESVHPPSAATRERRQDFPVFPRSRHACEWFVCFISSLAATGVDPAVDEVVGGDDGGAAKGPSSMTRARQATELDDNGASGDGARRRGALGAAKACLRRRATGGYGGQGLSCFPEDDGGEEPPPSPRTTLGIERGRLRLAGESGRRLDSASAGEDGNNPTWSPSASCRNPAGDWSPLPPVSMIGRTGTIQPGPPAPRVGIAGEDEDRGRTGTEIAGTTTISAKFGF